jgi:tetratricopeptide (TPR) repeat protein
MRKKTNFIVSPTEHITHPIANAKAFLLSNSFLYYYMLAAQYERIKDYQRAEANFEKAFGLKPDYRKGVIDYAHFLLRVMKFDKSLKLIENIHNEEDLNFEYYLIKREAYKGMEQYEKAIENLVEGNKFYNSDTRLLNSLGLCYYKTKKVQQALDVLKASLRLNPDQEKIKKLIEELEKSLN